MEAAFVLVHSLLLGPRSWAPVAARLAGAGRVSVVPSLVGVTDAGDPPFWPGVVATVNDALADLPADQPIVLVTHSNAGLFMPVLADAAQRPVAGCLLVDAALPADADATPAATPEHLEFLRTMVSDGRLPPWTQWWNEDDIASLFPDPHTRAVVAAEQSRLPLSYYRERIPVPVGWDARPCGYLVFGPPYDRAARKARERGWPVEQVSGGHLHQLVDPDAVSARIVAMTAGWAAADGR